MTDGGELCSLILSVIPSIAHECQWRAVIGCAQNAMSRAGGGLATFHCGSILVLLYGLDMEQLATTSGWCSYPPPVYVYFLLSPALLHLRNLWHLMSNFHFLHRTNHIALPFASFFHTSSPLRNTRTRPTIQSPNSQVATLTTRDTHTHTHCDWDTRKSSTVILSGGRLSYAS